MAPECLSQAFFLAVPKRSRRVRHEIGQRDSFPEILRVFNALGLLGCRRFGSLGRLSLLGEICQGNRSLGLVTRFPCSVRQAVHYVMNRLFGRRSFAFGRR
jgi:hypothetical protein